jgi:hypothetical protein
MAWTESTELLNVSSAALMLITTLHLIVHIGRGGLHVDLSVGSSVGDNATASIGACVMLLQVIGVGYCVFGIVILALLQAR